ncbi:hypothetical protein L6R52_23865 [Myxococcota bacterium]|nr:hypothetical protein [Myxococcota bacterium]
MVSVRSLAAPVAAALALSACTSKTEPLSDETSLYALVRTAPGVAFHPPLGPQPVSTDAFDSGALSNLSVVLEATDADGAVHASTIFDASTSPALRLAVEREVYTVNVPAAAYVTDPSLTYHFRIMASGTEVGLSTLSDHVFTVLAHRPDLLIGVHVRVEASAGLTARRPASGGGGGGNGTDSACNGGRTKTLTHAGGVCEGASSGAAAECDRLCADCGGGHYTESCSSNGTSHTHVGTCTCCVPSDELCDGEDQNCDGVADDGSPGSGAPCDTGLPGACGVGETLCANGGLTCVETTFPSVETCNGVDDDCDGAVDDGVCGSECSARIPVDATYSWRNTIGHTGTGFSDHGSAAAAAIADSIANDNDGQCNVGPLNGSFPSWGATLSGCSDISVSATCPPNGTLDIPNQRCLISPCNCTVNGAETCNGRDDDCDGLVDEGNPGGGATCTTGQPGDCSAGTIQCVNGGLSCVQTTQASAEVCNGRDDDCDGVVDDGSPGGGATCTTGQAGACAAGTTECTDGGLVCRQTTNATTESCGNGVDEDCDGVADDGCPTCSDAIQNQGEAGIDCGGPCAACTRALPASTVSAASHRATNGEGNRDSGTTANVANITTGMVRYRTGASSGFVIDLTLARPTSIGGLRLYTDPTRNNGYAGIRISTNDGSGFVVRYTDTRMFGITGRNASAAAVGGGSFGANFTGVTGTYDHVFQTTIANVTNIRIETGMNDEASDACYSMGMLQLLGP